MGFVRMPFFPRDPFPSSANADTVLIHSWVLIAAMASRYLSRWEREIDRPRFFVPISVADPRREFIKPALPKIQYHNGVYLHQVDGEDQSRMPLFSSTVSNAISGYAVEPDPLINLPFSVGSTGSRHNSSTWRWNYTRPSWTTN